MQQEETHLIRLRRSYTCPLKNNFQSQRWPAVTVQGELGGNLTTVSGTRLDTHTKVPIPDLPTHTEELQREPRPESYSCANSPDQGWWRGRSTHVQGAVAVLVQEDLEELSHVEGQEGW